MMNMKPVMIIGTMPIAAADPIARVIDVLHRLVINKLPPDPLYSQV